MNAERKTPNARLLWLWIAQERQRRSITPEDFAKGLGVLPESLRECEESGSSPSSLLIDALERLDALGAMAEIDELDMHGAAVSLSDEETDRYDALAERSGVSRAEMVKRLAAEGLKARGAAGKLNGESGVG